jgi:hypothetical protein
MADESPTPPETEAPGVEISRVNTAASEYRPAASAAAAAPVSPLVEATTVIPAARPGPVGPAEDEFHISEFAANVAGSLSPFGDDVEFPLPAERLSYRHSRPVNRPALAED